jgi:hypothetical protein
MPAVIAALRKVLVLADAPRPLASTDVGYTRHGPGAALRLVGEQDHEGSANVGGEYDLSRVHHQSTVW